MSRPSHSTSPTPRRGYRRRPGAGARTRAMSSTGSLARAWVVGALLGSGLGLAGCQTQMTQPVGCNVDSDCPNNLHCDPTGRCVAPPKYVTLTVAKIGDGDGTITSAPAGISCGDTCSTKIAVGEPVTLTAAPAAGSAVSGFSVGCSSKTATCSFTPTDSTTDVQVLVNFTLGAAAPAAPVCNGSGYCWENPRPQGNRLNKAVVVGTNDEWAVGDTGTIVHRTSSGVTLPVSGVTRNLYSIWASGTDLYAVGEGGIILHSSSGGTWTAESSGVSTPLYDVAGNATELFAVGAGGVIRRRNAGAFWTQESSPTARDLRGLTSTPSGDLYAVGDGATVVRYSGGSWTTTPAPALGGSSLNAIAATATGSPLYMTSTVGEIFRLSAGSYTRVYQSSLLDLRAIAATPFGLVVAGLEITGTILRSTDGTTWTVETLAAQSPLYAVAAGSTEVVAVGEAGTMVRYDGSPWTPLSSGRTNQLRAVHAVDATHGWAVGLTGTLLSWNGTYFSQVPLSGNPPSFYGVYTVSATDAWAVGTGGAVWRWNGTVWTAQASGTSATLRAVWAAAANKVYVVGDGGVALLWDGTAWNQVGTGNGVNLWAVAGSGPTDVWAAGENGVVLRSTGGAFTAVAGGIGTTATVGGIFAAAPSNVWFAADTSMFRYDGAAYTKYSTTATGLRAVSGAGAELWAVGNAGALVHWNGAGWDAIETGTRRDFYSIFLGTQKQWIAGDLGTLLSKSR